MKVVKVYGALRKRLGQCRFAFDVDTPAQAIKALCVNFPGLEKWLIDSEKDGVGYRVTIGKEKVGDDLTALVLPWSEREVFSITPVIAGAGGGGGGGFGTILAGAALIGVAILSGGAGLFAGGSLGFGATAGAGATVGLGAKLAIAAGNIGIGLVALGVAQVISPQPEPTGGLSGAERGKDAARFESSGFSNVVNTTQQGLPVPIAYGRVFVGSAILSSGLDIVQKRG